MAVFLWNVRNRRFQKNHDLSENINIAVSFWNGRFHPKTSKSAWPDGEKKISKNAIFLKMFENAIKNVENRAFSQDQNRGWFNVLHARSENKIEFSKIFVSRIGNK